MYNSDLSMSVAIAGDFSPIGRAEKAIVKDRICLDIYGSIRDTLNAADLRIVNLETPLTSCEEAPLKTGPSLKADPKMVELLADGCFDVVTLANNHIMDFGGKGLHDTLHTCSSAGIQHVGAGSDLADASKPLLIELFGQKLAILNAAENEFGIASLSNPGVNPQDIIDLSRQIRELRRQSYAVLLVLHGGHEFYALPSPATAKRYRFWAEAGASAIVAHHTHCVSGYEVHAGVPIFYGIGNFLFDWPTPRDPCWYEGAILTLTFLGQTVSSWEITPLFQSHEESICMRSMTEKETNIFFNKLSAYNSTIANPEQLEVMFNDFCSLNSEMYNRALFLPHRRFKRLYQSYFTKHLFSGSAHRSLLLNLMRCEAHREVCLKLLDLTLRDVENH